MKKITIAGALAIATFATFAAALPTAGGDGKAPPAPPVDNEAYPSSCNGAALVKQTLCPATITYTETTSASTGSLAWTPTSTTKPASFTNATVGGSTNKIVSCIYTSDTSDRMSITMTSSTACIMSKKFRGANCCK